MVELRERITALSSPLRVFVFFILFLAGASLWAGLLATFLFLRGENPLLKVSATESAIYSAVMYLYLLGLTAWFWRKVEKSSLQEMGLPFSRRSLRRLLGWSLFGFVMLALLRLIEIFFHLAFVRLPGLSLVFLSNIAVALLFAISEEVVFRGLILQTLLKGMGKYQAILISAGIWALAHFLHPGLSFPESLVSMLGLWTAGILLGYAYTSTRSLWTSIGIHAGWIYFISVSGQMNVFSFTRAGGLFHGNGSPTSGILGFVLTALFLLLFINIDGARKGRPSE